MLDKNMKMNINVHQSSKSIMLTIVPCAQALHRYEVSRQTLHHCNITSTDSEVLITLKLSVMKPIRSRRCIADC